jgi:Na+/alanine symporter
LADTLNGLMLLPNIVVLVNKSDTIVSLTRDYKMRIKQERKNRFYQRTIHW